MSLRAIVPVLLLAIPLGGCGARSVVGLATAPFRAASQAADWATTSQDEADRARGREIRGREEEMGRLQRDFDDASDDCVEGDDAACREAILIRRQMQEMRETLPLERGDA